MNTLVILTLGDYAISAVQLCRLARVVESTCGGGREETLNITSNVHVGPRGIDGPRAAAGDQRNSNFGEPELSLNFLRAQSTQPLEDGRIHD